MTNKLPFLPSALAAAALEDFQTVLALPKKYRVNMGNWYEMVQPDESDEDKPTRRKRKAKPAICELCFGGAVMALSLDAGELGDSLEPADLDDPVLENKIYALDAFRMGSFPDFFEHLGININHDSFPDGLRDLLHDIALDWVPFESDKDEFIQCCEAAIDALEEYGY